MRLLSFVFLLMILHFKTFSQSVDTAGYIRGEMHAQDEVLAGYFKFDHEFSQNGQTVWYKKDLQSSHTKRFQSYKYEYFTSDSVYMELFGVMPYGLGDIKAMVPRVINGPIQLFYFPHNTPFAIFAPKNEPYLIKTDNWKKRVSKRKFKEDMKNVLGETSPVYAQITQNALVYDDIPLIVQLANMNADEQTILEYIAHKRSTTSSPN